VTENHDADGRTPDDAEQFDIQLAEGLSPEQADEAMRIFAALRATRQARDDYAHEPGAPVALCPVRLADGTPCFLPLPHDEHRNLGSGGEGHART
jgi:hypothetical protein